MATETKNISFEENLKKLEMLVKDLETGETPLDEAIEKFNEALKLAKVCDEKIKKAEDNVNKILGKNGKLEDFQIEEQD